MSVKWAVADYVASELNIDLNVSQNIVELFEDGHEIPFIARYRRHLTQNASPDDLRHALKAFEDAKALKAKVEKFMKRFDDEVQASELQKQSLKSALMTTMDEDEFTSLIAPFKKSKKRTLAAAAAIMKSSNRSTKSLEVENGLKNSEMVEKAVFDYLSSAIHRNEETQKFLREVITSPKKHNVSFLVKSSVTQKGLKLKKESPTEFKRYELYEALQKKEELFQDHQILAIHRGCTTGYLKWTVEVRGGIEKKHPGLKIPVHHKFKPFIQSVIADSTKRFFLPSIERFHPYHRHFRKRLFSRAEESAVDCFASNLRELFLTAPLKGRPVLAVDPGIKHGCKCALVDKHGNLMNTGILFWQRDHNGRFLLDEVSEKRLVALVQEASARHVVIAVGNGKENRSVQEAVALLISKKAFAPTDVEFCVVSECGSSVYSASDIGIAEFPDIDINLRSAVSIARRVLDPISEYVKIPPESLGVGSYQHSVNAKLLREMLDQVVKECVSNVGVDINVASSQVLEKVAGLNKKTVSNIIKYREENGRILSRKVLQGINGIGPKTFQQCAGFLYIFNENSGLTPVKKKRRLTEVYNPLDATPVHPESYNTAEKIIATINADINDVNTSTFKSKLLKCKSQFENAGAEYLLVWELLCRPTLKEVFTVSSIEPGQVVEGTVSNHTQFGTFIDIGIGFAGLLHVSEYRNGTPPKVNSRIKVRVKNVDLAARRVGFALCSGS
ncbi:unnamed protein product [Enterobius vermicularis]|uniref:S1 motif domain-containing protein n=1 Tax=Enterobius vermicularis TaxID=51028 RepID=A0A0N4V5A3_ENTVE|nr:unnamed protein product [Enterobius vermicularis]